MRTLLLLQNRPRAFPEKPRDKMIQLAALIKVEVSWKAITCGRDRLVSSRWTEYSPGRQTKHHRIHPASPPSVFQILIRSPLTTRALGLLHINSSSFSSITSTPRGFFRETCPLQAKIPFSPLFTFFAPRTRYWDAPKSLKRYDE